MIKIWTTQEGKYKAAYLLSQKPCKLDEYYILGSKEEARTNQYVAFFYGPLRMNTQVLHN